MNELNKLQSGRILSICFFFFSEVSVHCTVDELDEVNIRQLGSAYDEARRKHSILQKGSYRARGMHRDSYPKQQSDDTCVLLRT